MANTRPPYTPEFRRQLVELVRAGRSPDELFGSHAARENELIIGWRRDPVAEAESVTVQNRFEIALAHVMLELREDAWVGRDDFRMPGGEILHRHRLLPVGAEPDQHDRLHRIRF